MNIRPYAKLSFLIALGLASASYLFLYQVGKYDSRFAGVTELWQKVVLFLLYLMPYFFGVLAAQGLYRQKNEGARRLAIVLSIVSTCGVVYYLWKESGSYTNDFIASVGWYVSAALIALFLVFSVLQWLVSGFFAKKTEV
jgi:hypothetical protein